MKYMCACGHMLHEYTDNHNFIGSFIPNQTFQLRKRLVKEQLLGFIASKVQGEADAWKETHYPSTESKPYQDSTIIDFIVTVLQGYRFLYECDVCGRLLYYPDKGGRQSYRPEGLYPIGIFHDDAFDAQFGSAR